MINQLARYLPVLPLLEGGRDPILEIGCGAAGMARWTRRPFVGCDRAFDDYADARVDRDGPMRPVRGDATRLPFRDGSFGLVLCLDMLEHVPEGARPDVVRELCRVCSGRLILAFPWGRGISVWDRRLERHLRRRRRPIPVWLTEHLSTEPPDPERVAAHLRACGFAVRRKGAAPAVAHYALMCAEARPRLGRKLGALSRRISRVLTGRPRHRIDDLIVRSVMALYPVVSSLTATRRGYRALLVADAPGTS